MTCRRHFSVVSAWMLGLLLAVLSAVATAQGTGGYIGCYIDKPQRDINTQYTSTGSMTIEACAVTCRRQGYKFAGLQYGSQCFCGNRYGRYGKSSACNMPCAGNKSQTCGGTWANSVYAVGAGGAATPIRGTPGYCRNYANTAVTQNRENRQYGCGYGGNRWTENYQGHYQWCMGTYPGNAASEDAARSRLLASCRSRRYESRWDKIGGPGGPWTTGWVRNHKAPVCGHGAQGCNCGSGRNYCGTYRSGQATYWWPRGCSGPRWTIRCTSQPQR